MGCHDAQPARDRPGRGLRLQEADPAQAHLAAGGDPRPYEPMPSTRWGDTFDVVLQIDTLQVVRRSQYLVVWSRLGSYDPADLDALMSPVERRLFEGWQHAACLVARGDPTGRDFADRME